MAATATSSEKEVQKSVASIYSELLNKRRQERETKEEKKYKEREEREQEKDEKKTKEDGTKMSKKERREAAMDSWKEVIVGLTGDDLDYSDESRTRKKYRKWIDDDAGTSGNTVLTPKPKKVKKRNYQKEFEPEIHQLKTIVADQNKFTIDLQKRFMNAAGPATKDAMPLNKTLVELAAAINASRSNSLGYLNAIGNLKKTIADLYMKQKKMDYDMNGSNGNIGNTDLGLMGSNIAATLFSGSSPMGGSNGINSDQYASAPAQSYGGGESFSSSMPSQVQAYASTDSNSTGPTFEAKAEPFDPSTWDGGPALATDAVLFETIPHSTVVEWDKTNGKARFKAVRDDTGEELIGCPVPTSDPSKLTFNEKDLTVRGEFDENYKLEII